MSTKIILPPRSPFSSLFTDISCALLTVITCWAVSLSDSPDLKWLDIIFNKRGAVPYLILFSVFRIVATFLIAKTRKELPGFYLKQFFAFSFFPILLGLIGAAQGLGAGFGHIVPYLMPGKDIVLRDIIGNIAIGGAVALDSLFLGSLGTVLCIGLYIQSLSLTYKCVQPVPDYRHQSVPQPEP